MKNLLPNIVMTLIISMFVLNGLGLSAPHQALAEVIQNSSGIIQNAPSSAGSASSICSIGNIPTCLADLVLVIPGYIAAYLIMPIMSLLVYLSGMILNISMEYSVVHMSMHYQQTRVDYVWTVVRDLANMGFIFVLLYTAIMTMVGKAKWQSAIKNIVIAALLINFSLLITKAIVDASNVLAMLFYNAITPSGTTTTTGLASGFMRVLNLQSLQNLASGIKGTQMAIVGIAGSMIYLIASFTFLAVAVMFLIRFVALVFVIALSPIYALAMILPQMRSQADIWLKTLINQSFFAPAYFALTWIALKVAEGLLAGYSHSSDATTAASSLNFSAAILGQSTGNTVKANPDAVGVFVMFAIIIGLLLGALATAKSMSAKSHPALKSITQKALGYAGGATLGLAGRAGRGTFGRAGINVAESEYLKENASKGGFRGGLARLSLAAGEKTAKSSFDLRATGIGAGLGGGKAQKGGFVADAKEKAKDAKSFADSLKPSELKIKQAEDALKEAQKSTDQAEIARAQAEVDRLKGADENEMRKRRIREIREASGWTTSEKEAKKEVGTMENRYQQEIYKLKQTGLTQKQAEDKHKENRQQEIDKIVATGVERNKAEQQVAATHGWKPEEVKSLGNQRKETVAKSLETPNTWLGRATPDTARVLLFGKLKRENISAAAEIRKGMKEKKSADKIADEIAKQAKDAVDDASDEGGTPKSGGSSSASSSEGGREPGEGGGSRKAASE